MGCAERSDPTAPVGPSGPRNPEVTWRVAELPPLFLSGLRYLIALIPAIFFVKRPQVSLLLLIAYVFNYLDRQILGILAGPIIADLHLNDRQFGLLSGPPFAILYSILGIPFAFLADRTSRSRVIAKTFCRSLAYSVAVSFRRRRRNSKKIPSLVCIRTAMIKGKPNFRL